MCMPLVGDVSQSALGMEERLSKALKLEETAEDTIFVSLNR